MTGDSTIRSSAEDLIVESPVIHLYKKEEDFKSALSIWKILKNKGIDYEELDEPLVRENEPNLSSDYQFGVLFRNSGFSSNPFRLVEKMSERFLSDGGEFIHESVQYINPGEQENITLKLENRARFSSLSVIFSCSPGLMYCTDS